MGEPFDRKISRFDVSWFGLELVLLLLLATTWELSWPGSSPAWIYAVMAALFIGAVFIQAMMRAYGVGAWWLAPVGPRFGSRAVEFLSLLLAGLLLGLWFALLVADPHSGSRTVLGAGLLVSVSLAWWVRRQWPALGSALAAGVIVLGFIATAILFAGTGSA